ncbi:hypothetical protein K457DRAFT_23011 [Linnemannia elongata AG-77]|uniref:Uncharacterized protein n=1 Tax=Linnemannia elongata AG-77 TaxID=1314771 RepID=A0A197JKQ0_9FUNG|nr:hypothetical protein K457DRAFT_23011 [Linnemannia elongata AG-77]
MSKVFLSFQEDVVAAVLMKKVVLPKNIPENMLRALEVSSSNQSNNMHVLRKSLTAVNDKLAHQTNQSLWANNILDAIVKTFLAQEQQLRIQRETIESMQQAIDAMARQLRLQGPVAQGNPGNLSYSRQSGIPGPGYLGYTGISTPAPGFLPHLGPWPFSWKPVSHAKAKTVQARPKSRIGCHSAVSLRFYSSGFVYSIADEAFFRIGAFTKYAAPRHAVVRVTSTRVRIRVRFIDRGRNQRLSSTSKRSTPGNLVYLDNPP